MKVKHFLACLTLKALNKFLQNNSDPELYGALGIFSLRANVSESHGE